jgi:hypothetical protein
LFLFLNRAFFLHFAGQLLAQHYEIVLEQVRVFDGLFLQQVNVILVDGEIMHELHRGELETKDLLHPSLPCVRQPHQSQHLHLHRQELLANGISLGRVVIVDVTLHTQKQVILEDAPQSQHLVGDGTLVNANSALVEDLDHIMAFERHLVDEVIVHQAH